MKALYAVRLGWIGLDNETTCPGYGSELKESQKSF